MELVKINLRGTENINTDCLGRFALAMTNEKKMSLRVFLLPSLLDVKQSHTKTESQIATPCKSNKARNDIKVKILRDTKQFL